MSAKKLVLDTNFLMLPGQFGVDIFTELVNALDFPFELFTTEGNERELQKLREEGNAKDRTAANIALELIKAKNLKIIPLERDKDVDDSLVELAGQGYVIATADKGLQRRLKSYIYARQKKYIEIKGVL